MINKFILAQDLEVPKMMGIQWDTTDNLNYWYKEGNNNILLVAHIDTLPRINNTKRFKDKSKPLELTYKNGIIKANDSVLGADDRAGCFAIHELYNKYGTACSILLTNFEETGGIGVNKFITDFPDLLNEYKLFIELDRQGVDEFTYYNDFLDLELESLLYDSNFNYALGSYSDIMDLTNHYGIQSFNLSVGYYNQHTKDEYLDYNNLINVLIPRYSNLISEIESIKSSFNMPLETDDYTYEDWLYDTYEEDVLEGEYERELVFLESIG